MKNLKHLTGINTLHRYAYAEYLLHLGVPASQVTSALGVDSVSLAEINRNQQFIDIMRKSFRKKPYETMALRELSLEGGGSLLGASIIMDTATVESVGQEVGAIYSFDDKAADGGSIYNQDWDAGIGGIGE